MSKAELKQRYILFFYKQNIAFVGQTKLFFWFISLNLFYSTVVVLLCQKEHSSSLCFHKVEYFVALLSWIYFVIS